jgi:DNA primase
MSDQVQQIKERLDIVEVISQYVELHKAGRHYKGKSPFTSEKTPSFYVSPDRGMYYCFSSNQGGDMFTFIEKMEGVDFKGALKILAEKAGVELVPEDPKKRSERDTQYALIEAATQFYFDAREKSAVAKQYLADRGVTGKTVHTWRIGFAPDDWRALKEHLIEKGYTESQMLKAGLVKSTDNAKESYDVFRNRVMFPIMDASGRVVAFSGRTLSNDADTPKYVNSPETELYQKSEILFGYDKARHGIRKFDFSLIVEGQFDLALAHQAGYGNTVAVSGTALTGAHVALLQRLSNRTVLALDSDRAGISAVKRAATIMLRRGMDIKVAALPEGKDPADMIREDAEGFKHLIGKAAHAIEFLLATLKSASRDERSFKLSVREELLPVLAVMPSPIDREHFEGVVAEGLDTTKDAIHAEIVRIGESQKRESSPAESAPKRSTVQTPRARSQKEEYAIYFATLLAILKTEEDKRQLHERLNMIFTDLMKEYDNESSTAVLSPDAINEYIAEVSKKSKRNYEETIRTESIKNIAEEAAHNLNAFARVLINESIKKQQEFLKEHERTGDNSDATMVTISDLQKKRENMEFSVADLTG